MRILLPWVKHVEECFINLHNLAVSLMLATMLLTLTTALHNIIVSLILASS